jgi:hypothetical protein
MIQVLPSQRRFKRFDDRVRLEGSVVRFIQFTAVTKNVVLTAATASQCLVENTNVIFPNNISTEARPDPCARVCFECDN